MAFHDNVPHPRPRGPRQRGPGRKKPRPGTKPYKHAWRSRMKRLLVTLLSVLGLLLIGLMARGPFATTAGAVNPPGNNGTVKIDGVAFDDAPNNEPHVGCNFQVDFYNYDEGDFNANVRFYAIPPTGKNILLLSDKVFIGEDPANGGTDLDGSGTYNLSDELKSFMAHPQQGYHIKLHVNAPFSIGADKKHKAFWVQECAYAG